MAVTWIAVADGGAGWRAPTPQEKSFHHTVLTTIHKAMPPGPVGWQPVTEPDLRELTRVYVGIEKEPFRLDYIAEWLDSKKKTAGEQKVLRAQMAFRQRHENDPQVASLNKERQRLSELIGQAAGKNDTAGIQRYMKELDLADAKLKAIYAGWDKELDAIAAANEAHDVTLQIAVRVNVFYSGLEKMTPGTPVAGIPVYRIAGGHIGGSWVGEQNRVFLGKNISIGEANGMMVIKIPPSSGLPYTSVRVIEIFVRADPARARQVLESINWSLLKGLVK